MKKSTFDKIEVGDKVLVDCPKGTHFAKELHGKIVTIKVSGLFKPTNPPLAHDFNGGIWLNGRICCSKPELIKRRWKHKA